MESAHGEPHVLSDRASISRVIGFFPCRSDRCCHDERGFSSQTAVKVGLDAQCCDGCALIFLLLDPDRPGDARELVGQSAGGLVVIGARLNCERPTLEAINRSSGSVRHRRRAQHRTYCAGNSRTSMPRARSVLAQWCAEPQASITTRSTLRLSNQRSNCARVRRARSTIFQRASASASSKTFFARSTATVVAFISDSSCLWFR